MGNDEKENTSGVADLDEEGSAEEEYAVEKIISHRQTRKGLEYYVKWEGFTEADNTWEPMANLNCPDLVEAYNKEMEKKAPAAKQKASKPKEEKKAKRKSTTVDDAAGGKKKKVDKTNGFDKGFTAQEIIGATEDSGQVLFLIKWKEEMQDYELIPSRIVNVRIPQMVIAFYEARLTWSSGAIGEEGKSSEGEGEEAPTAEVAVS